MAQTYSVRCYKNTGFNDLDRPAEISVLRLAEVVTFPALFLRQNYDLPVVKIDASWELIKDIDYCELNGAFYIVSNITMLNDKTAQLTLQLDEILTAGGIDGMYIAGGWCERAHVGKGEDVLFGNIRPEPWQPTNQIHMDAPEQLGDPLRYDVAGRYDVVLSTVDLVNFGATAKKYTDAINSTDVTVPEIPLRPEDTTFTVKTADGTISYKYPMGALYSDEAPFTTILNSIQAIRSLGIENSIVKSYSIPKNAVGGATNNSGFYANLQGIRSVVSTSIPYEYSVPNYTVRNKKAYIGLNKYVVCSLVSGDMMELDASDIYKSGSAPTFILYTDVSPDGKPYIQPQYYQGTALTPFLKSVAGANWLNQPLTYTDGSGAAINQAMLRRSQNQQFFGIPSAIEKSVGDVSAKGYAGIGGAVSGALTGAVGGSIIPGLGTVAGAVIGGVGGAVTGSAGGVGFANKRENARLEANLAQFLQAPDIKFPVDPSLQGYLGNGFMIYRLRYSDNDTIRYDHFLTQFGYSIDKIFVKTDLTNRRYFNYIKTREANIKVQDKPLRLVQAVNRLFDSGVRIWHVLPNGNAMIYNPIKED